VTDIGERPAYTRMGEQWLLRGGGVDFVTTEERDLSTEDGPQHRAPAPVDPRRPPIVLELDGEKILRAEPVIGYMHRAAEKLSEHRDHRQVLVLMNRHDWLSAFNNELGSGQVPQAVFPPIGLSTSYHDRGPCRSYGACVHRGTEGRGRVPRVPIGGPISA
jgi:hypothetical protein